MRLKRIRLSGYVLFLVLDDEISIGRERARILGRLIYVALSLRIKGPRCSVARLVSKKLDSAFHGLMIRNTQTRFI